MNYGLLAGGGGIVYPRKDTKLHSAVHHPDGILMVHGKDVLEGAEVKGAGLEDLAPTIFYLLGETLPGGMDGEVLGDLFSPERLMEDSPQVEGGEEGKAEVAKDTQYSAEDEQKIKESLAGLGYLG